MGETTTTTTTTTGDSFKQALGLLLVVCVKVRKDDDGLFEGVESERCGVEREERLRRKNKTSGRSSGQSVG